MTLDYADLQSEVPSTVGLTGGGLRKPKLGLLKKKKVNKGRKSVLDTVKPFHCESGLNARNVRMAVLQGFGCDELRDKLECDISSFDRLRCKRDEA